MGSPLYNASMRSARATSDGYFKKSVNEIFTQNEKAQIHESMNPKGLIVRECRNSANHPSAVPIIVGLDVTGSMLKIPHELIKNGLPTLMSNMIQKNVDASVCFIAIGDHEYDRAPLQVGQFESGDKELDLFLTRTWLEGHGGGNAGESYLLAWYFAAKHVAMDADKGLLFTIGDEPCLPNLPEKVIKEIFGSAEAKTWTKEELLTEAQKKFKCFHICVNHDGRTSDKYWSFMGQNLLVTDDYTKVPDLIADTVVANTTISSTPILAAQHIDEIIL